MEMEVETTQQSAAPAEEVASSSAPVVASNDVQALSFTPVLPEFVMERGPGLALSDTCFKELTVSMKIYLTPKFIGEGMVRGVHEKISQHLMKYVDELDGVLLSYWNLAFLDNHARILFERPELHFRIRMDALLFSPTPGTHLVGHVNKVGEDHVGLLILGIFNASITAAQMGQFSFVSTYEGEECWQHNEDSELKITLGREIRFKVIGVNVGGDGMVSIVGALDSEETGPTSALTEVVKRKEAEEKQKQKKKEKEKEKQKQKRHHKEKRRSKGKEKVKGDAMEV